VIDWRSRGIRRRFLEHLLRGPRRRGGDRGLHLGLDLLGRHEVRRPDGLLDRGLDVLGDLGVRAQRLGGLRAVAVDGQRLDAAAPGLDVRVGDVLDRRVGRHVHRLGDRTGDEGLDGAHHLDVAHVRDRAGAHGHVEHGQVLVGERGRSDDRVVLVDVRDDLLDLLGRVAQGAQRERHGLVDDGHRPAADELLVLHEREVGLHAGRVAIHQERDRPRGGEHGGLRVAVAVQSPSATASFQHSREAASSSVSAQLESGIAYEASRCIRMTLLCASRFSAYASYGPIAAAILADCR
jgi:hypothetical protein